MIMTLFMNKYIEWGIFLSNYYSAGLCIFKKSNYEIDSLNKL